MGKIRVRNAKQLNNFLRILAEESVKDAKSKLDEAEPAEEEEAEEEPAEEEEEEEPAEDDAEEEPEPDVEEEEEEPEEESADSGLQVDFISFRDNIDSVRSGRSLKRSEVKQEVETFFNRLGSQDKRFFHDALQTLGKIMVGEVSGADAALPSGPEGGDMGPEPDASKEPASPEPSSPAADSGLEPPIRIGESQDKMLLRKKVRQLMGY